MKDKDDMLGMLESKKEVDVAALLVEMKAMSAKIAALEGEKVADVPTVTLDVKKPYATHRTEGAVTYEQFGRKYDGKKRLVEG